MRHISMSETSKGGLWSGSDVRFGSLANIAAELPSVRFTLESGRSVSMRTRPK